MVATTKKTKGKKNSTTPKKRLNSGTKRINRLRSISSTPLGKSTLKRKPSPQR
ncbi:hypothetical protein HYT52_04165, partial [Candidatus Woesearchaeota archaeon]|nr:hypothetical protein [Candidatus Woesearchaeota archaeon]